MTIRFDTLADKLLQESHWLSEHCDAIAKEDSPYWECWWEELECISKRAAAEIDAAARLLANGKLAEPPTPEICAFLLLRVQMAVGILNSLEGSDSAAKVIAFPKPVDAMKETELIEWLLIDFWNCLGKQVWQWVGYWDFDMWQWSHEDLKPYRISDDTIVT